MTPTVKIILGDCLTELAKLPAESVHCCVTSPPYWGLRDYGVAGQIGLEKTPEDYVAVMVGVFREVRRVLREDATCWINLGDNYWSEQYQESRSESLETSTDTDGVYSRRIKRNTGIHHKRESSILKPKDLCGMPWRVAFALQNDGWVLRQEIIWEKPNPMPESVTDRCTKAHEQIFLFCKAKWTGEYPSRNLQPSDARWLALLLETEGCISIRRYTHKRDVPQHALQIAVANSDRSILEEAQRISACGSILNAKGTNRPMFYLQWTTKEAASLLWEMYPYLFGKRKQAEIGLMLESRRSNSNKGIRDDIFRKEGRHFHLQDKELELREKMWLAVKSLNRHRPVDISWLTPIKEGKWVTNRYFYDAEAIKEKQDEEIRYAKTFRHGKYVNNCTFNNHGSIGPGEGTYEELPGVFGRNKRSVWTVPSYAYPGSHFATFPPDLIKPCILAGTSAKGCCPKCGAPWERMVETKLIKQYECRHGGFHAKGTANGMVDLSETWSPGHNETKTIGWQPTCQHGEDPSEVRSPIPCTVIDPFGGSGTTGQVALELGRNAILIELNPQYVKLANDRTFTTPGLALA